MIAWILLTSILLVSNCNGFLNAKPGKARQGGFDAGAGFNKLGEFVVPGKLLINFVKKKIQFIKKINVYLCQIVIKRLTLPPSSLFVTIICGSNFF